MTIAHFIELPTDPRQIALWSFQHAAHHLAALQALKKLKGISVFDYQLEPINPADIQGWLERHQLAHNDMNGSLGIQGNDLQTVDFKDDRQRRAWSYLQWNEHISWDTILKL